MQIELSGEGTTLQPYNQLYEFRKRRELPNLRTATFLLSIERVAKSYTHHGIPPKDTGALASPPAQLPSA